LGLEMQRAQRLGPPLRGLLAQLRLALTEGSLQGQGAWPSTKPINPWREKTVVENPKGALRAIWGGLKVPVGRAGPLVGFKVSSTSKRALFLAKAKRDDTAVAREVAE